MGLWKKPKMTAKMQAALDVIARSGFTRPQDIARELNISDGAAYGRAHALQRLGLVYSPPGLSQFGLTRAAASAIRPHTAPIPDFPVTSNRTLGGGGRI